MKSFQKFPKRKIIIIRFNSMRENTSHTKTENILGIHNITTTNICLLNINKNKKITVKFEIRINNCTEHLAYNYH